MLGDPSSPIWRYRGTPTAPHVFARGTLRRAPNSTLPALCSVQHERYQRCGKTSCWKAYEGMEASNATVDVEWSSSPLPSTMSLSSSFRFEPRGPAFDVTDPTRAEAWKRTAQRAGLGFKDASFVGPSTDRIVEACLDAGQRVFLEACVSPSNPGQLEPCAGFSQFGVIAGEPQSAIDAAADDIAIRVGGAFFALLVGLLAVVRPRGRLAEGLEDRGPPHRRQLGKAWALLSVPVLAGFANVLLHASPAPSTWATGRGGFVLGISVLSLWALFALSRMLHRTRTLAALAPVLATPRSVLAEATGTAELMVRARLRNDGVRAFIGDDVVTFSEIKIVETYQAGKNTSTIERLVFRLSDEVEVVDESGDGVLDLSHGILDVEVRKVKLLDLSPRYAERGVRVDRHPKHLAYEVEERIIRAGEPLYVLGDVSGIKLKSSELGYRAVSGAPTLGGAGVAPVLVHAGDERGLVSTLSAQARAANSLAVVAGCASTALAALLGYLASL